MWDTLAITYKGSFEVQRDKLSLVTCRYELFSMEEREKISNHVTTLRAINNLDSMTLEELVGILKVDKQELAQDERTKKGKSLALTTQRPKCNSASKESSSKALAINDALEEEYDDDDSDEEDEKLSLITRKIRKMWKNKNSSRFNSFSKRSFHKKEKSAIICYECKKPGHFKNKFFKSKKKSLMSTWEDLDEDNEEEANLLLDASSNDEDPQPYDTINSDGEEVIFKSKQDLIKREDEDLKKIHQAHLVDFILETTSLGDVGHETHKCKDFSKRATHQRVRSMLTNTHELTRKKDPKRFRYLKVKQFMLQISLIARKKY
ncbi:hypothetical protein JHK82_050590 [Glycine max]|uniref:CCHC-type domain-containing protein n=1 Tax=Glycine max TaxID=3847 RepID=A0A0R0F8R7_SOYBN|nr:hypothetical protein JHK86_050440 [Glycine max]KAG4936380.1 hypothetical protein JHK85_051299 [Glycine max]KAG5091812.1 hypothetical protein JHK82_050590 [Glycine max]KAG5094911.1 hypothetical protein JHK84_050499 [Glycine max]